MVTQYYPIGAPASPPEKGGRRIREYQDYLRAPYIRDRKLINQIVEQLKNSVITTELHEVDGYRYTFTEPTACHVDTLMAKIHAGVFLSRQSSYACPTLEPEVENMAAVEAIRRLEMFCCEPYFFPYDIHKLVHMSDEKCSFTRLFRLFNEIDAKVYIDMYCPESTVKELVNAIAKYFTEFSLENTIFSIGTILKKTTLYTNKLLFQSYGNLFTDRDDKSVFDLNVDSDICSEIMKEHREEYLIFTELLMRPLTNEAVFDDYVYAC